MRCGNAYHFFEKKSLPDSGAAWDVQKVDLGIAIYHFMTIAGGTLSIAKPDITADKDTEYIATVTV